MEETVDIKEKIKNSGHKIGKEFKKSISTAVIAAFSLIVALAWKDVITSYVVKIQSATPIKGELITALFITLVSVLGILIISKILGTKEK
jgi:preprotein translocase subunit SecD